MASSGKLPATWYGNGTLTNSMRSPFAFNVNVLVCCLVVFRSIYAHPCVLAGFVLKQTHWHSQVVADRHRTMKNVDWRGWEPILELIDNGVALAEIVDRWGRSVHPAADDFLS